MASMREEERKDTTTSQLKLNSDSGDGSTNEGTSRGISIN